MRVCVVGCGAVGTLFAANLATLDDVEVWAFDLNESRTSMLSKTTDCNWSEPARSSAVRTRRPTRVSCPCEAGIVATKAMHADSAVAAATHSPKGPSRR